MLKHVGEKIRKAREVRGISQKKLGISLGLSDKAISAYEAGRTYPPIDTLEKIAQELDKPVAYFLSDDPKDSAVIEHMDALSTRIEQISKTLEELKKLFKTSK